MIVTYNWLKEFVDFDLTAAELSDLLTMLGLEVEGMECRGEGLDDVVVALVEEKAQHPNADKLSLCRVNNGREVLSIVCGAQNFKAGDKVALAQIGAVLPGNFKIKRSKIRGEESFGMLCSEKELGLAEESAGIMVLPADLEIGAPLFSALGLKDTIFEIGLTPNRADCLSVIGVAREIAAKLGKRINYPEISLQDTGPCIADAAAVTIEAPDLCPRYTARYITGCEIAPSPAWLVDRLKAVGLRPISNVVDVTNYVLMEYGHPLHAFDYEQLAGGKIIVRRAEEGERFTTLDGQERPLTAADLTIRDAERVVALAGIMGGENSEISGTTTAILLESAYFNPSAIRKTSKRLGLHTESSHRFERGMDIAILTRALDRAASLIAELAGGTVAKGVIDVYPVKSEPRNIRVRLERVNSLLGISLSGEAVTRLLLNLEFGVRQVEPGVFDVDVPTFRVDIEREVDIIEEVARLNGYENIPFTMPMARVFSDRPPREQRMEGGLRDLLVALGFNEVVNFSFGAPDACNRLLLPEDDDRRNTIKLLNPLVEEQSVMRTTLLPGLLETAARNCSHRTLNQKIFELRRVYLPRQGSELPVEPMVAAGLLTGLRFQEGWSQSKDGVDFYDAKAVVENIFQECRIGGVTYSPTRIEPFYHPGKACTIFAGDEVVGTVGEIHPDVQEAFGLEKPVYYFELKFEKLVALSQDEVTVVAPSRFPETYRDIAMLLDDGVAAEAVVQCVSAVNAPEIGATEIFDLYKGEHVPAGKKSIAIRVKYRSAERTLTDEEVSGINQRIIGALQKKLNAIIR
jgi:phenylalanyl-tRNA synthetase beta chain